MYTLQFFHNPYTYPDYGTVTAVGDAFVITGVDIDDNAGMIKTDKLTFAQRFSVNYLKLVRDDVTLWGFITSIERLTGDKGVMISFKIDPLRSFRDAVTFGTQYVVRHPMATMDFDPLLRGASGTVNEQTVTQYNFDNPVYRMLVVQILREDDDGVGYCNPVQPSPYILYFKQYNMTTPESDTDIRALMSTINNSARPSNLISIYSVPVFGAGSMSAVTEGIPLIIDGVTTVVGSNFFKLIGGDWAQSRKLTDNLVIPSDILRTHHSVNILIPEAGVINVPDELLFKPGLKVRQDIDIYSGASNFMLVYDGVTATQHSIRGGGVSPIPIAYDIQQQLLAVNRSNIQTGILGDVASIGIGIAGLAGAPVTGGISGYMGAGMIAKGAMGLISTVGALGDTINQQTNPPAFLGSALTQNFNQVAFLVITRSRKDNADIVHARYGYPCNQIQAVTIPSSGYIQTQDCNVIGNIPTWARKEINQILDSGLRVV